MERVFSLHLHGQIWRCRCTDVCSSLYLSRHWMQLSMYQTLRFLDVSYYALWSTFEIPSSFLQESPNDTFLQNLWMTFNFPSDNCVVQRQRFGDKSLTLPDMEAGNAQTCWATAGTLLYFRKFFLCRALSLCRSHTRLTVSHVHTETICLFQCAVWLLNIWRLETRG